MQSLGQVAGADVGQPDVLGEVRRDGGEGEPVDPAGARGEVTPQEGLRGLVPSRAGGRAGDSSKGLRQGWLREVAVNVSFLCSGSTCAYAALRRVTAQLPQ